MVSIDQELKAAEAAKATLSTPLDPEILPTLRNARDVASRGGFSGEGALSAARMKVAATLSILIPELKNGSLVQEKLDNAKAAIEDWVTLLQERGAGQHP
jgi:hypothetical protein